MAYLHGVPKYAFGTAFELAPDSPKQHLEHGEQQQQQPSLDNYKSSQEQECNQTINRQNEQPNIHQTCDMTSKTTKMSKGDKRMTEKQFKKFLKDAIRLGCRHFDCAPLYKTQHLVGQVLSEIIEKSTVPRQQFFITSKLPPNMMRLENIERSIMKSIEDLQVNYLDLFLIHGPFSTRHNKHDDDDIYPIDPKTGETMLDDDDDDDEAGNQNGGRILENAWLKLVDLKRKGLTRFIGISNVNLEQLTRLNSLHHVDVVQNEYHIYNQNRELFDHCEEIDVHFEAYAAFGSPARARAKQLPCALTDPLVTRVARRNRLSVAQVIMQWIDQQPLSYVIKCDNLKQLKENLRATKYCSISVNDLIDLDTLNKNIRMFLFDEHKGLARHREYPFKGHKNTTMLDYADGFDGKGASGDNQLDFFNETSNNEQFVLNSDKQTQTITNTFNNNHEEISDDSGGTVVVKLRLDEELQPSATEDMENI